LLDIFVDADLFSCPKKDEIADLQGRNEKKVGSGMGVGVTLPRPQLGIGAAAESVSEGNRAEEEIAQLSVHVDKMLHLIHLSQMRSSPLSPLHRSAPHVSSSLSFSLICLQMLPSESLGWIESPLCSPAQLDGWYHLIDHSSDRSIGQIKLLDS
jgi:hypothetical protein